MLLKGPEFRLISLKVGVIVKIKWITIFESKFRYCRNGQFTLEVWDINFICYFNGVIGKTLISKTRFQPILRFSKFLENAHWKSNTSKNNFKVRVIFPFSERIKKAKIWKRRLRYSYYQNYCYLGMPSS